MNLGLQFYYLKLCVMESLSQKIIKAVNYGKDLRDGFKLNINGYIL